jgi:histidinol-phosphate aminotransferase
MSRSIPLSNLFLDRNENLYGPAPKCFDVLKSISINELSVYSRDFTRGVKSSLSERLASEFGVPEVQLLLGEGSEDLLKQAVHCYMGPGEKILCPAQSWWYYQALASEVAGETITYALKEGKDAFYYDVDDLVALYRKESPKIVLIASPNNPTGNSFPNDQLKYLVESFRESIIVLDEAYWGFGETKNDRVAEFALQYRNLMITRTFSKYYALAGARIGFAVVGSGLSRLTKFAARYLGYNRISELLALAALDSAAYYDSIRIRMCEDRKEYYRFFDALPGFKCFRSDANFVLVRVPSGLVGSLQRFLGERGITIKFFADSEFRNCIRITIGTENQNKFLIRALKEFSATESGRSRS